MPVNSKIYKGVFNPTWTLNSLAALTTAFLGLGVLMDVAFYFIALKNDLIPKIQFDYIVEIIYDPGIQFFKRKVVVTFLLSFFILPLILVILTRLGFRLFYKNRSNLKLLFLWGFIFSLNNILGYLAFAALGDRSKVLTGLMRRKFKIILEYLNLSEGWLPFLTAFVFTTYAMLGSRMFGRFLLLSPSFSLNKNPKKKVVFLLNVVIFPMFIFTVLGQKIYFGGLPYESRYQNMLIFWIPSLVMLYRAYRNRLEDQVPAQPGSWIDFPDIILYGMAIGLIILIKWIIPNFFY